MTAESERLTLDRAVGTELTLRGEDGRRYSLQIEDELREAVRRSHDRPGPGSPSTGSEEGTMDTPLRPRDIQARIRAGATAEEVADAARVTVEKVLVYARPVLAERAHMAQRAQRSSVRRSGGDATSGHRTLGDAVEKRLRAVDADPGAVEWDSRKREDGRWVLTASYTAGERSGLARFTFDPPGNFVTIDDDDARWLLGDESPAPGDPLAGSPTGPRLVSLEDDELPLGGDALRLVADPPAGLETYAVEPDAAATPPAGTAGTTAAEATSPAAPTDRDDTRQDARGEAGDPSGDDPDGPDGPDGPDDEPPARRRVRKRGGRASVPSWDEIMFGGGRKE